MSLAQASTRRSSSMAAASMRGHLARRRGAALDQRGMLGAGFRGGAARRLGLSRAPSSAAAARRSRTPRPPRACRRPAARSTRALRPARASSPAISSRTRRVSVATRSARCCTRESSCDARGSCASSETMAFSWRWSSALEAPRWRRSRGRSSARTAAVSSASAASATRSAAMRSRSSLISRLVARMPRDSTLSPPVTRCAPRKTSPSIVATGNGTSGATRVAVVERLDDQRVADRRAQRAGERADRRRETHAACRQHCAARGASRRCERPCSERPCVEPRAANRAGDAPTTLKPQRPASSWRIEPRGPPTTCSMPLDQHVLQQLAEARLDGALVARLDLDEVGERAHLPDAAVGVARAPCGRHRRSRRDARPAPRASAGAPSVPASSCSRDRTSRARHSCSMRALASSDLARRRGDAGRPRARPGRGGAARSTTAAPTRTLLELGRQLARLHLEALRPTRTARSRCAPADCEGGVQCGDGVEHRVDVGAGPLDVLLHRLDGLLGAGVVVGRGLRHAGGGIARLSASATAWRRPSSASRSGSRRASRCWRSCSSSAGARLEHRRLLAIERDLLLAAIDLQLAGVRRPRGRGRRRHRLRSARSAARRARSRLPPAGPRRRSRSRGRRPAGRGRTRWPRPARDSGARTAPSPSAASRRAAACSAAPSRPAA